MNADELKFKITNGKQIAGPFTLNEIHKHELPEWAYDGIISRIKSNIKILRDTEFKDMNGVSVFEGDMVTFENEYCKHVGQVFFFDSTYGFEIKFNDGTWGPLLRENVKIIGNKYENPELLTK